MREVLKTQDASQGTSRTLAARIETIKKPITILLATDRQYVRTAFVSYLSEPDDLDIVANVKTVEDALADAITVKPDIAILNTHLARQLSFDIAKQLREQCPQLKIIFLSAFFEDSMLEQALSIQASSCITEDEHGEAVVRAIRQIVSGGRYFSAQVKTRILIESTEVRLASNLKSPIDLLTAREFEILQYIAWGKPKKDIAHILKLSINTINRHSSNVMTKLGIRDRVQLARFAIREGLIEA